MHEREGTPADGDRDDRRERGVAAKRSPHGAQQQPAKEQLFDDRGEHDRREQGAEEPLQQRSPSCLSWSLVTVRSTPVVVCPGTVAANPAQSTNPRGRSPRARGRPDDIAIPLGSRDHHEMKATDALPVPAHPVSPAHPRTPFDRREDRVTFELHRAVAKKLVHNPERVKSVIRGNLAKIRQHVRGDLVMGRLDRWDELSRESAGSLIDATLSTDELGKEMRQNSPFMSVLSQQERLEPSSEPPHEAVRAGEGDPRRDGDRAPA